MVRDETGDALTAERQQLARILHKRELGLDPDIGGRFRPTEANVAADIEAITGRRLARSRTVGDWVDQAGRTYDAVGPAPTNFFRGGEFTESISAHLSKSGLTHVVVDLRGLTPAQVGLVDHFLLGLSAAQQSKLIVLR